MFALVSAVALALLPAPTVQAGDESGLKPDSRAMQARFRVVKERYDSAKRRYVWVLEAKQTSDRPCKYDAAFRDADDREIASATVEFEDGGNDTVAGQRYTAFVKYPTRKALERAASVVIKKSD